MARTPMTGPTLASIAERAGVSIATVSKVINGRSGMSEATRARVEEAVRELGYRPTPRSIPGAPRSIHVVFDTLHSVYSLRVLDGMVAAAQRSDIDLVTRVLSPGSEFGGDAIAGAAAGGAALDRAFVDRVAARGALGMIVVTTSIASDVVDACLDAGIALVAVDSPDPLNRSVASIGSSHATGGQQAVDHLVALGHRRIGFVGGHPANPGLRARAVGYREALLSAGIPLDPRLVSEEGMGTSATAVRRMLALDEPPTAVFATNDADAFAVIRTVVQAGLRVPEDVSVVGYDDTYSAMLTFPLLTTVHTSMHDIGRAAVDTLLRLHAGEKPFSHHLELATTLIERESTAPAPTSTP
ncbi:transcriptional regulator, LacI family [Plantibacter flavus]|uniref:LacI family transcriptional regulator n=1 Tax=Plantibacter flavus TaxID=150123 RepID=A0A3N2C7T4_9MICO|nr:LacI family DNA-binding transcriptional regulator [Plantibacter flavus]ROR83364.1 LacI family transcriptional regulator [Plantibacter flavus]SMG22897.1 transcriptional regulator, LacI family [Plantibacter flavus]